MRRKGRGSSSSGGSTPLLLLLWLLALRLSASALPDKTTNDTRAGKREEEARGAKTIALEVPRKVDPYIVWNTTAAGVTNASRLAGAGTSVKATVVNPRYSARQPPARKYPVVHYAETQQLQLRQPPPPPPPHDKPKTYNTTVEDYEHRQDYNQQIHSYGTDYYAADNQEYNLSHNQNHEYEDSYNTIPEDQSHSGYDGVIADPLRVAYVAPDPGYFGPPIIAGDSGIREPPQLPPSLGALSVRECNCPEIRTYQSCDTPSNSFMTILSALGQNLWDLVQLIATSSLPFLIPLLVLKMIIVPLKILKFIKLIKLFVKFFIILPFFMRYVYPALSNTFDLHSFLFQKIQDSVPSDSHHGHVHPHDAESRDDANASSSSAEYLLDATAMWDLRACPSRVSCELGSFLANSVNNHFPNNIVSYLKKRADRAEGRSFGGEEGSGEEDEEGDDEDKEDDRMQRSQTFKAFLIALGKRWTQEQCEIYSCAVLF